MAKREEIATAPENEEQSWILSHVFQLSRLIGDLLCRECEVSALCDWVTKKTCFAAKLKLKCSVKCSVCDYEKCEFSSPRIGDSDQQNGWKKPYRSANLWLSCWDANNASEYFSRS